ncbi:MAG: SCP2 sterol-binding domain-containing protein [Actinomycetota bacterium]
MARFASEDWWRDYIARINGSSAYREVSATWEGAVAFGIGAEPDKSFPETVWGILDLWHGECRGGGVVPAEEGEAASYVIRAPYSRWKSVVRRELDPIKGIMQGKLKLQGDLPTIIRYVKAAQELVLLVGEVPTEFPDEP